MSSIVDNHLIDSEHLLLEACKDKNARIAELEAAVEKMAGMIRVREAVLIDARYILANNELEGDIAAGKLVARINALLQE